MTRGLRAIGQAFNRTAADKTDKTDRTGPAALPAMVVSVKSVLSGHIDGQPTGRSDRRAVSIHTHPAVSHTGPPSMETDFGTGRAAADGALSVHSPVWLHARPKLEEKQNG